MSKHGRSGIALVLGAVFGAILAFLFGTDKKGDTKKEVKETVKKTKEAIEKVDKKKVLESVEKQAKVAGDYIKKAKTSLEGKLKNLETTLKTVDKEKYQKVVNEVVAELKKTGSTTSKQLTEIKDFLMADYTKITKQPVKKSK